MNAPAHVVSSFNLTVPLPYPQAAALFGPEGERAWAGPAWDPQFIHPQPAHDQQGAVFTIAHVKGLATWVNTVFDLEAQHFQYVYVIPEVMTATIDVAFNSIDATHTAVHVTYARTALNPVCNDYVIDLGQQDAASGPEWQAAIEAFLEMETTPVESKSEAVESKQEPETTTAPKPRRHLLPILATLLLAAAIAIAASYKHLDPHSLLLRFHHAEAPPTQPAGPGSCDLNADTGCLHGTLETTDGKPLANVPIEALPVATRSQAATQVLTDDEGRYSFNRLEPGAYIVGVRAGRAPSAASPYPATFYPNASDEPSATHLTVAKNQRIDLLPLQIRTLPLTTFTVEVRCTDGTHPAVSNLLVSNTKFPEATIGVAPIINKGKGSYTLPQSYDYLVNASVSCDQGDAIAHLDTPNLPLHVTTQAEPSHLVLTLPGKPCKLWLP